MHNAAFHQLGIDAVYLAFDVKPDQVCGLLGSLHQLNFGGLNITLPLKERVQSVMTTLDHTANLVGAVNTVVFTPDGMVGHNTDSEGLIRAVAETGTSLEGKRIVLLGSGGAARAAALSSAHAGATEITVVARNTKTANALISELHGLVSTASVRAVTQPDDQVAAVASGEVVLQCTPVGLKKSDPPIFGMEAFRAGQTFLDMIYHVPETSTMTVAKSSGAKVTNGLGMLLHQGATRV